ncbi:MAG: hypothetical protein Q9227_004265 [Pyrenula ochraceoflavens]
MAGSIKASAFSNETTLALANAQFDFSLVKVEAHPDFALVGPALTRKRRSEAEDGPQHKTARRLATLFEQLVPSTPKLISAYGKRVSEILNTPGVNPEGKNHHGPFKDYIGADGTAIWAAATSGTHALGIYLLAALLAQAWDFKTATSIWVELVEARKNQIFKAFECHETISQSSLLGAQQEISRDDLSAWDASARAWLHCTETAKRRERTQHMLISKNISSTFTTAQTSYESVICSWQSAMNGLEDLFNERPQMLTDAAMMLAFKAWNLYPDMIVLGKEAKNVQFKDTLIPPNAIVTLGSMRDLGAAPPSRWSLTLSHLRYYGRPKAVLSESDPTRLSADALRLTAFGALLGCWGLPSSDITVAANFINEIWTYIGKTQAELEMLKSRYLGWLGNLAAAARLLLLAPEDLRKEYLQIVYWGQRRAMPLLGGDTTNVSPYFGLSSELVLCSLTKSSDADCAIAYLREIAARVGVDGYQAFIIYTHYDFNRTSVLPQPLEIATTVPSSNRAQNATFQSGGNGHTRWLIFRDYLSVMPTLELRQKKIEEENEAVYCSKLVTERHHGWEGKNTCIPLPSVFHSCGLQDLQPDRKNTSFALCGCAEDFQAIFGNVSCGLFVEKASIRRLQATQFFQKWKHDFRGFVNPARALARFQAQEIFETQLWNFLCLIDGEFPLSYHTYGRVEYDMPFQIVIAKKLRHGNPLSTSLHTLAMACSILESAGDVTVSARIISSPIHNALWIPAYPRSGPSPYFECSALQGPTIRPKVLTKPCLKKVFSCLAYLESGSIVVAPSSLEHVFALCLENSIYVAARLLGDPTMAENHRVCHLVGNIGKPGVSFLVAPNQPEIRDTGFDYRVVNHSLYDGRQEDNFKSTSLHLSLTSWSFPLNTDSDRHIDKDAHFVEAVVKVYEGSEWVADLNIMEVPFNELVVLKETICRCSSGSTVCPKRTSLQAGLDAGKDFVSLDCWEELLDPPLQTSIGIFRAHGNWAARLAAVSVLTQQGKAHSISLLKNGGPFCLQCMEARYVEARSRKAYNKFQVQESANLLICID